MSTTPTVSSTTPDESRSEPPPSADTPTDPGGRDLRSLVPWIVVIALLAISVIAGYGWSQAASEDAARDDIQTVAGRAVSTLTTWDASDLGPVEQAVTEFGTERFQQEANEIFGEFSTGLEQAQVTSTGEVLDIAVAEISGSNAVALATVRQEVTNTSTEGGPVESCWGARVMLVEVDGSWLVDHLSLFGPNACEGRTGGDS